MKQLARIIAIALAWIMIAAWVIVFIIGLVNGLWFQLDLMTWLATFSGVWVSVFVFPVVIYYLIRGVHYVLSSLMR